MDELRQIGKRSKHGNVDACDSPVSYDHDDSISSREPKVVSELLEQIDDGQMTQVEGCLLLNLVSWKIVN